MSTINRYTIRTMAASGICLLGGAQLVLATAPALAAPPPSYPIVCCGGGTGPPGPGQCAWLDCPVGGSEPTELIMDRALEIDSAYAVEIKHGSIQLAPLSGPSETSNYLVNATRRGEVFHLHA